MSNSNRIKIARSLSRENLPSVLEYGEPAYVKNAQFVIGNGDGSEFIINDWSNLLNKPSSFPAIAAVNPGVNFANGHFEASTAGWVRYDDGAVASPVDGTGGTPSYFTFARTATTPLIGTGSGLITKSAANAIGEGVSYDFTIDRGIVHEPMKIEFQYESSANYADGYIGVFLYDRVSGTFIPLSVQDVPASYGKPGTFLATFIPSTSTEYRLIFHVTTATTTAWTMMIDNVVIGNKDVAVGAAISEWQSYTPTWTYTPQISNKAVWKRNGSSLELKLFARWDAAGSGTTVLAFSIPAGLTIDLTKLPRGQSQVIGNGYFYRPDIGVATSTFSAESETTISVYNNGTPTTIKHEDITSESQVAVSIATVPIAQWTSNVNLASDFTEYAYNYSTTETDDITSFAYGTEGAVIQTFAPSGIDFITKRVRFLNSILPTDDIQVQLLIDGQWINLGDSFMNFGSNDAGTVFHGIYPYGVVGDGKSIDVKFTSTPYFGGSWAAEGRAGRRWRVRKVSNGNMAEVPPLVRAKYVPTAVAIGVSNTIIQFNTKVEDTHNAVTTGTSWRFTAPISGVYSVTGFAEAGAVNLTSSVYGEVYFTLYVNGIGAGHIGGKYVYPAATMPNVWGVGGAFTGTIRLNAGDYFDIRFGWSTGHLTSAATWSVSPSHIEITRIGS